MVAVAEAHPNVGMVSAYRLEENFVDLDGLPYSTKVLPGREACHLALTGKLYLFASPSSHLIRSALMRGEPFYDESLIHADTDACFRVLQHHDLGFVHQVLSYTRRHNESITSHVKTFDTNIAESLKRLHKYGPACLESHEMKELWKVRLDKYYLRLAQALRQGRDAEYWNYHKQTLAAVGLPFSRLRLLRARVAVTLISLLKLNAYGRRPSERDATSKHPTQGIPDPPSLRRALRQKPDTSR
jgi:hypothetical protein